MARPKSRTVPYFAHFVTPSETISILIDEFGNDGYAFWFRLLEALCRKEGHYINVDTPKKWKHLCGITGVDSKKADKIIETLLELDAIDIECWDAEKGIWVQNLVDNISKVYDRRVADLPTKPICQHISAECQHISAETPYSIQYKSIQKDTIPLPSTGGEKTNSNDLITHFGSCYQLYTGVEYHASFAKDNKLFKGLADHYGNNAVLEGINYFFDVYVKYDDFSANNPTVGILNTKWNSMVAHSQGKKALSKQQSKMYQNLKALGEL